MAELINPREYYFSDLKDRTKENAKKYFEALAKLVNTPIDENIQTVKEIRKLQEELKNLKKKLGWLKFFRIMLILVIIGSVIGGVVLIFNSDVDPAKYITWGIILIVFAILVLFYVILSLSKKILELKSKKQELEAKINELIAIAWKQMEQLNASYDDDMATDVFNMTIDKIISLDKKFDNNKFYQLVDEYGMFNNNDKDSSVALIKSGQILGNPFLIYTTHDVRIVDTTYTGSITITWTTTVHTKDGSHTEYHSQTLTAEVTAPAPRYSYMTHLIYGNDAAPNLSFSRSPSGMSGKSEQEIKQTVNKKVKKLDKKSRKDLTDNDPTTNYTRFSHDEFEALFGGTDRDNEVEYRLLFTPIAIYNELDIIKNKEPYGDDFYLEKRKKLNMITSSHSQRFRYDSDPSRFVDYSYEDARDRFIDYCDYYFKGIYFDLAPLIAIPLYQQTKPRRYIYNLDSKPNFNSYQHEMIANTFNYSEFCHPETTTDTILKTSFSGKDGSADRVSVTAYSYKGVNRRTYIAKLGGDGRMHDVPVDWVEYFPLENEKPMELNSVNGSRREYNENRRSNDFSSFMSRFSSNPAFTYRGGIIATILNNEVVNESFNKVSNYFKGLYNNSSILNNSNINNSVSNSNKSNINNSNNVDNNSNINNSSNKDNTNKGE